MALSRAQTDKNLWSKPSVVFKPNSLRTLLKIDDPIRICKCRTTILYRSSDSNYVLMDGPI